MEKTKKTKSFVLNKISNQRGYAILFTVVLVSVISLIGIGLSNTTYKHLMLSSGAKDSQLSFYESDMATECALYADNEPDILKAPIPPATISCGVDKHGNPYVLDISYNEGENKVYSLDPTSSMAESSDPCFRIKITKIDTGETIQTIIRASGYNVCNMESLKTVERTIEVRY